MPLFDLSSEKTGSTWKDYIFFGGQPFGFAQDKRVAEQTGSTAASAVYLHTDHLSSTRRCTDADGSSAGTCDYEPFGENQPGTSCSVPTRFRFAGMDFDADTALYHTWFREYDPNQGRWMAVDPLPGSEDDPQSRDRYAYVRNDPVNFLDPLGLDCEFYVVVYDVSNERVRSVQGYYCGGTAAPGTTNCDKTKAGCNPGGGSPQQPQPPPPPPPCDAKLPSNSDASFLTRLIFAEATRGKRISSQSSSVEMAAIGYSVVNRVNYLSANPSQLRFFGAESATVQGVANRNQYASVGSPAFSRAGNPTALGKKECDFLKSAIAAANGVLDGTIGDPFGFMGGTYGFRTAGHGAPGGNWFLAIPGILQQMIVPGSGNTFWSIILPPGHR